MDDFQISKIRDGVCCLLACGFPAANLFNEVEL